MARKRQEKGNNSNSKGQAGQGYLSADGGFSSFKKQLSSMGLDIRDVPGDGNCLFRALGDQLDGHIKNHFQHRQSVAEYIVAHRADFEPFIEDGVTFEEHVCNLRNVGTYAGNDAIVAFAKLHKLTVVIHQLNSPLWKINGSEKPSGKEVHISYHNGDHYASVRRIGDLSNNPANIKLKDNGTVTAAPPTTSSSSYKSKVPVPVGGMGGSAVYQAFKLSGSNGEFSWQASNSHDGNSSPAGHAIAHRGIDDIIAHVKNQTGCMDEVLIKDSLEENNYNVEDTIDFILQIWHQPTYTTSSHPDYPSDSAHSNGHLWTANGTGTRLFGSNIGQTHNLKLTAAQKKAERKTRQMERHKARVLGMHQPANSSSRESSSDEEVLVQTVGTLCI